MNKPDDDQSNETREKVGADAVFTGDVDRTRLKRSLCNLEGFLSLQLRY